MSVAEQEVQELSLLEQLRFQRNQFIQQKDLAQVNLNQLIGAIFACDEMIKRHEEENKKELSQEIQGDELNVKTDHQSKEQVA